MSTNSPLSHFFPYSGLQIWGSRGTARNGPCSLHPPVGGSDSPPCAFNSLWRRSTRREEIGPPPENGGGPTEGALSQTDREWCSSCGYRPHTGQHLGIRTPDRSSCAYRLDRHR